MLNFLWNYAKWPKLVKNLPSFTKVCQNYHPFNLPSFYPRNNAGKNPQKNYHMEKWQCKVPFPLTRVRLVLAVYPAPNAWSRRGCQFWRVCSVGRRADADARCPSGSIGSTASPSPFFAHVRRVASRQCCEEWKRKLYLASRFTIYLTSRFNRPVFYKVVFLPPITEQESFISW